MLSLICIIILVLLVEECVFSLNRPVEKIKVSIPLSKGFGNIGGQCWGEPVNYFETEMMKPSKFPHLGDYAPQPIDDFDAKKRAEYNLNVGRCQEVLRRELPMVFLVSDLDFSIFAPQIVVSDGQRSRLVMQRNLYAAVVKSLKLASTFSFVYPSMNVKKIEYIDSCTTIQCLVDIVLPDSIRIDGQALWEGMFYFGLDSEGLIESHTFDKKISTMRPSPLQNVKSYPWLKSSGPQWTGELVGAAFMTPDSILSSMTKEGEDSNGQEPNVLDLLTL